jgi:TP901 family phage tail tape measure protein
MPRIADVTLGFGLSLSRLQADANNAINIFQQIQKGLSRISLEGAIKGDPFTGVAKGLDTFDKKLNKAFNEFNKMMSSINTAAFSKGLLGSMDNLAKKFKGPSDAIDNLIRQFKELEQEHKATLEKMSSKEVSYPGTAADKRKATLLGRDASDIARERAIAEATAKYEQQAAEIAAKGVTELRGAYELLYKEARKYAGTVAQLNDLQKLRVGYQVVHDEAEAIQRAVVAQQRYIESIKLGINVLENERELRKSILNLALRGITPDKETMGTLTDSSAAIAELQKQYAALDVIRSQAMAKERAGSSSALRTAEEAIEKQKAQLQSTIRTRYEYNLLTDTQKALYQETRGYGMTVESLDTEIRKLDNDIKILKDSKNYLFKDDIAGANKLALDINELEQRLTRFKAMKAEKSGMLGWIDFYREKLKSLQVEEEKLRKIEANSGPAIEKDAAAYRAKTRTLQQLTEQYERLGKVRDKLSSEGSPEAIAEVYKEQSRIAAELVTKEGELTALQKEQAVSGKYGVQSYRELKAALEGLVREQKFLKDNDVKAMFQQSEQYAQLYKNKLRELAAQILQTREAMSKLIPPTSAEPLIAEANARKEAVKAQIESEAEAYKKQVTSLKSLEEEYKRLTAVRQHLLQSGTTRDLAAADKVWAEQAKVLVRMAELGRMPETDEQKTQYANAAYGVKTYKDLDSEIKSLISEYNLLLEQPIASMFKQDADSAKRYADILANLTARIRAAAQARSTFGDKTQAQQDMMQQIDRQDLIAHAEKEAVAFRSQIKTIAELTREYAVLEEARRKLLATGMQQDASAAAKVYEAQAQKMVELVSTGYSPKNKDEIAQYLFGKYGVRNLEQISMEAKKLQDQLNLLRKQEAQGMFAQDRESTIRYKDAVADLEMKLLQLARAKRAIESGGELNIPTKEKELFDSEEQRLLVQKDGIRLERERHELRKSLTQTLDLETKYLATHGVNLKKITDNELKNETIAKHILEIYKQMNAARERGVPMTKAELQLLDQMEAAQARIAAIKKQEAGLFVMDAKRLMWFAQLRAYWAVYQLIAQAGTNAIQFEQNIANVGAVANATDRELVDLSKTIAELGTKYRFSSAEIAEGAVTIAQAGFTASESMQMIRATTTLAAGTLSDMNTAANLMTTAMEAWNLETRRSAEVSDIFASAINASKLTMNGLVTAFNYITGVAPELNMTLQETSGALAIMANAGLNASIAGTSLRAMLSSLMAPNERLVSTLRSVGLTINDVSPSTNSFADILLKLKNAGFSVEKAFQGLERRASTGITIMVQNAEVYQSMVDRMYELGAAEEMASKNMSTMQSTWKQFSNIVSNSLYSSIQPFSEALQMVFKASGILVEGLGMMLYPIAKFSSEIAGLSSDMYKGLSVAFGSDLNTDIMVSTELLGKHAEKLKEINNNIIATEQERERYIQSYSEFSKQIYIGREVKFGTSEKKNIMDEINARTKAVAVASELGMVDKARVRALEEQKRELQDLAATEMRREQYYTFLGKAVSLTKELTQVNIELDEVYQRQISHLTMRRAAEERQAKNAVEDVAVDKVTILLQRYQELEKKSADIRKGGGVIGWKNPQSTRALKTEADELNKLLGSVYDSLNKMSPEEQDSIMRRVGLMIGKDTGQVKARLIAVKDVLGRLDRMTLEAQKEVPKAFDGKKISTSFLVNAKAAAFWNEQDRVNAIAGLILSDVVVKGAVDVFDKSGKQLEDQAINRLMAHKNNVINMIRNQSAKGDQAKAIIDNFLGTIPQASTLSRDRASKITDEVNKALVAAASQAGKTGKDAVKRYLVETFKLDNATAGALSTSIEESFHIATDQYTTQVKADLEAMRGAISAGVLSLQDETISEDKFKDTLAGVFANLEKYKNYITKYGAQTVDALAYKDLLVGLGEETKKLAKDMTDLDHATAMFRATMNFTGMGANLEEFEKSGNSVRDFIKAISTGSESLTVFMGKLKLTASQQKVFRLIFGQVEKKEAGRKSEGTYADVIAATTQLNVARKQLEIAESARSLENDSIQNLKTKIQQQKELMDLYRLEEAALQKQYKQKELESKATAKTIKALLKVKDLNGDINEEELKKNYGATRKDIQEAIRIVQSMTRVNNDMKNIEEQIMSMYGKMAAIEAFRANSTERAMKQEALRLQGLKNESFELSLASKWVDKLVLSREDEIRKLDESIALTRIDNDLIKERMQVNKEEMDSIGKVNFDALSTGLGASLKSRYKGDVASMGYITQALKDLKTLEDDFNTQNYDAIRAYLANLRAQYDALRASANKTGNKETAKKAEIVGTILTETEESLARAQKDYNDKKQEAVSLAKEHLDNEREINVLMNDRNMLTDDLNYAMEAFDKGWTQGLRSLKSANELAYELGKTIGQSPQKLLEDFGQASADWGMQFMGKDTQRMQELKDTYRELEEQRKEALEKGDSEALKKINDQMERTHHLMEKEKRLTTQLAVAWKSFVDIAVEELMRLGAQLLIVTGIKALLGPLTGGLSLAFAGGGVTPGAIRSFSSGGITSQPTLALIGDNPSKKELVIPAEKIKRDSVSGYVRDSASESKPITIVNALTNEDIASAMLQDSGQKVIVNTIGQDLRKKGPIYRIIKEGK